MAFKKGQSGNPAGRPEKAKVITQMLTSALNEAHTTGDKTKMRAVIDAWISAAIAGELSAITSIADRLDGKPMQESTVTVDRKAPREMTDGELAEILAGADRGGAGDDTAPIDPSKLN